ncbi:triosephosphate isomerase [Saccharothrix carnea]|uniref:Triosephosphate isomerase n=1 Tax=Saccharothrix carnea TaxID=1280637 RepID=A0A2P8I209_SACCR|nr:triose-phosphate isomerase family protein [Saccharothrix carnea]PSL52501.1 triosephosphate isomerase [Saccharothrix carnea]
MGLPSPFTCTNTKVEYNREQLFDWLDHVVLPHAADLARLSFFACVPHPLLIPLMEHLRGSGVAAGAQDCAASGDEVTGEVDADLLAELGCRHVMLGHADRRRVFGEDDVLVARKAEAAARAGITPLVCVGEEDHLPAEAASRHVAAQVRTATSRLPHGRPVVILYEPNWAIGARQGADPHHAATILRALRAATTDLDVRFLYGGAVIPGTYTALRSAGDWDGVAIGRAARDPGMLAEVTAELLARG